jgi:UDP-N-acetylmuramate dehydrogenase
MPLNFKENVLLKEFCTFGIGGPARYFAEIRHVEEMQEAICWCHEHTIDYMTIGKGSNCLFDDQGYHGAILLNKIDFFEQPSPGTFHIGAGYSFALLGVQTARKGWGGLEFASGIPASVGGAVYMNAGANGNETSRFLTSIDFIDEHGKYHQLLKKDLNFTYRHSPFQNRKGAIVGATFTLLKNSEARHQQIEIVNKRKETQPYGSMSAGCMFLNPSCGHAGAMIEKCGLKGFSVGDAHVSKKHANFLINAGNASCQEMQTLIALIKDKVRKETGVDLQSEVRYIPYKGTSL